MVLRVLRIASLKPPKLWVTAARRFLELSIGLTLRAYGLESWPGVQGCCYGGSVFYSGSRLCPCEF